MGETNEDGKPSNLRPGSTAVKGRRHNGVGPLPGRPLRQGDESRLGRTSEDRIVASTKLVAADESIQKPAGAARVGVRRANDDDGHQRVAKRRSSLGANVTTLCAAPMTTRPVFSTSPP